jgi:hypothetical protein
LHEALCPAIAIPGRPVVEISLNPDGRQWTDGLSNTGGRLSSIGGERIVRPIAKVDALALYRDVSESDLIEAAGFLSADASEITYRGTSMLRGLIEKSEVRLDNMSSSKAFAS